MNAHDPTRPLDEPGVATAEGGHVLLDGPDGVAVTMTAAAAIATGDSLIAAGRQAMRQTAGER